MVSNLIEGYTLEEAAEKNKLFMCDLQIVDGIPCPNDRIVSFSITLLTLKRRQPYIYRVKNDVNVMI